jgi:hypothetical protein
MPQYCALLAPQPSAKTGVILTKTLSVDSDQYTIKQFPRQTFPAQFNAFYPQCCGRLFRHPGGLIGPEHSG